MQIAQTQSMCPHILLHLFLLLPPPVVHILQYRKLKEQAYQDQSTLYNMSQLV